MMNNDQIEYVRGSLIRAANTLDSGNAVNTLYGAMLFLTKTLRRAETDVAYVDDKSLSYRRDVCGAMTAHARHFAGMCGTLPASAEAAKQLALLEQEISEAENQLDGEKARIAHLEEERDALTDAIASAQTAIAALEEALPPLRSSHTSLNKKLNDLQEERDGYVSSIPELKHEIADADAEVKKLQDTHEEKKRDHERLEADLTRLRGEIKHLDELIRQQPDELRTLHEQHTALERELEALRTAQERCSPEAHAELRSQIDELSRRVELLKTDHALVAAQHDSLKALVKNAEIDTETTEKAMISALNKVIADIDGHLHIQEAEVAEARRKADTFAARLEDCDKTREQYAGWFDSVIAPLECMCEKAGLTRTENEELYKTFDPGAVETVRKLITETGDNLARLDEILRSGMQSATADHRLTRRRAETNERFARSHS